MIASDVFGEVFTVGSENVFGYTFFVGGSGSGWIYYVVNQ